MALIIGREKEGHAINMVSFTQEQQALKQHTERMQRQRDMRTMQQINTNLGAECLKFFEKDIDHFSAALAQEYTSTCEPITAAKVSTLRGMIKDQQLRGDFLERFDLGYVPKRLHMVFLFFLRMNQHISALHAKNINLKADVIRYLLKDFVNLREFTLSFADGTPSVVGGGYSDIMNSRMYNSTKRREIGSLIVSILNYWQHIEYIQMEKFQFNTA